MILIIFFCCCLQYNHFEITGDPFNLLSLSSEIYSRIALFFALNRIISVQISFHLCYFCFK